MDSDLAFALGLLLVLLAVPSAIAALTAARWPAGSAFLLVAGAVCVVWAMQTTEQPYRLRDVPDVVMAALAWLLGRGDTR